MPYSVYINHPNNKAIVHSDLCSKYRLRRRDETHNGYWSQLFSDFNEAIEFARETGKKTIDCCADTGRLL